MNKLFFKDINGNVFSLEKIVGFIKETGEIGDTHYLVFLEGVGTVEVDSQLFNELISMVIILDRQDHTSEGE